MTSPCSPSEFTSKDIKRIARYTNSNFHTKAREFIAKKVCSPTAKVFKAIEKENMKVGYMDDKLYKKYREVSQKLDSELPEKLRPSELTQVRGAL